MEHDDLLKARIWTLGALQKLMDLGLIDTAHVHLKTAGMAGWDDIDASPYRPSPEQMYLIVSEPNSGIRPGSRGWVMNVLQAFSLPYSRKALEKVAKQGGDIHAAPAQTGE